MSLILITSITIRLVAMCWSIVLLRRIRNWRIGFLTVMLGLMALRQTLTLLTEKESWAISVTSHTTELPGLIVSIMAFLTVFFLERIITGRKRVEEELQERKDANTKLAVIAKERGELQEWINTFDTFVGKFDPNGAGIFFNEAPIKAGGLTKDDVVGKYFPDTMWWSHSEIERARIVECFEKAKTGFSSRIETNFRSADGTPVPIIFNCQPLIDDDRKVKYITAEGKVIIEGVKLRNVLQEEKEGMENRVKERTAELSKTVGALKEQVTERKKAEEALRDAYHRLEETQEQLIQAGKMAAMGQLAAGISHELNQPLTGIKGFAQTVLMDLKEDNPLREDLEKIVTQADKMDKIIQHVRLFARKSKFHIDEIDINQPIEDALMLLNEQLRVHNIRVKKSLSKDLPKIQGDQNQLGQVFLNLITNARDAIDSLKNPEGGEITIQSALSEDKDNIELTLKDTGCGISKEELGNIFNPFYTTKFPEGGMGLGLSIVYGIIESHKGSICVESKVGKETVFRIILPIA